MDAQPPVFSGTLKVRACHLFWKKTPVQLTHHRQDYRHALPVLLIRRPGILGGEFRVPLDPCIHPVRLLPLAKRMASQLEFALEYGWQTKQVRLRAPDAHTYRQWLSLVRAALESGRRPLASCDYTATAQQPKQGELEGSSLASTMNSSNATVRRRVLEVEEEEEEEEDEEQVVHQHFDLARRQQAPSEFFVLHHADYQPRDTRLSSQGDAHQPNWPLSPGSSAAIGSCRYSEPQQEDVLPDRAGRRLWASLRARIDAHFDWPAITHELFLQASVFYFLL
ncbi:spermatogenesis associated protein 5 [Phytophthora pseudosyringae]|uniref:Spermatogenesis associated protein 5 n=1 Tax=Phytophthora pseudosyringae TaxID=221518 RepID=A0A8T1VXU3_9STRA|nr:spermatogenesis associated protein 5 [Phytophthora pseudosyringae]